MTILVTGAAGFIGTHVLLELLESGLQVVALDNFANSTSASINRVRRISKASFEFLEGDVGDSSFMNSVFKGRRISAVIHLAGLKSVAESCESPLHYLENNVTGSIRLLAACDAADVRTFIFSSSATVYGAAETVPIPETCPPAEPASPYGRSKLIVEGILRDLGCSNAKWRIAILRYFNPIGAHRSGLLGEFPAGTPNNLVPYVAQVASGQLQELVIHGDDYPTPDGTGIRDYIHVSDLASGHISALSAIRKSGGVHTWNLGTGRGYSVLEVVDTFSLICGRQIPFRIGPRRRGDVPVCFADSSKAKRDLDWSPTKDLRDMLEDTWRWQRLNPKGYIE